MTIYDADRLERELKKQKKEEEAVLNSTHHIISEDVILSENTNSLPDAGENVELTPLSKPVDVSSFVVEFMQKNYGKLHTFPSLQKLCCITLCQCLLLFMPLIIENVLYLF